MLCCRRTREIYFADIKKVVLQYQNKRFSEEEIVKLAEAISSGKMDGSLVERVQHVKNIKENISVDKEKVMNNVCPTVPSNIRKNYHLEKLPRGKQRGKFFFGSKIAALNFRKLFNYVKGLGNYAPNPVLA